MKEWVQHGAQGMVTFVEELGVCVDVFDQGVRVGVGNSSSWGRGEATGSSNLRVRECLMGGEGSFTNTGVRGQSPRIFRLMCMV